MRRILLIGLMATGKSTIGRALAERLGWTYLDNDELVRAAAGTALEDLRRKVGGAGLHAAEAAALRTALAAPPPVVAGVAASVVLEKENRAALRGADAYVVWLRARPATLAARVGDKSDRPWLRPDPLRALSAMAAERDPLYAEVSDLVVDVDDSPAAEAVARIQTAVEAQRPCS